ncbi:unannotated protein [freshwater metagenome]|uniref:Unannotated protein n=1 Tax=freshwater metagenome TaxID=449393 RepID=A0A6J7EQW7_9ZZZZ|nr:hypothetical protein [Actinomycetota bacterium]
MSEFDDSDLRGQLQRLAGHGPDDDAAYARLQRRVHVARRRRSTAMLGGLGVIVALGIATIAFNNRSDSQISPANSSAEITEVSAPAQQSTVATTAPTGPDTSAVKNPGTAAPSTVDTPGTTPAVLPATTPSPNQSPSTTTSASTGPLPAGETRSGVSLGGTITVRLQNGALTLVGTTANPGHTSQIEKNEATRVRVRFDASNGFSRIEVTIGPDGHMIVDVTENYSGG